MPAWLRKTLRINSARDRVLDVAPEGASLRNVLLGHDLWQLRWSEIEEIEAFKVDAITVDHLCLAFHVRGSESLRIADEDTPGWRALNEELASRFGVVFEEWFPTIAFPPFESNRTTLWRSQEPPATAHAR